MLKVKSFDSGEEFFLARGEYNIGRLKSCGLVLRQDTVSRNHCFLWHEKDAWWVRDLDSTNGTRVDGKRLKAPLCFECPIQLELGQVCMELSPWESDDVLADQVRQAPVVIDLGDSTHKLDLDDQQLLETEMDFSHCVMEMQRPEDFYRTRIPAYLHRCGIRGFGVVGRARHAPVLQFCHGTPPEKWLGRDEVSKPGFYDPLHIPPENGSLTWFSYPFRVRRNRAFTYLLSDAAEIPERVPDCLRLRLMQLAKFLYMITTTCSDGNSDEAECDLETDEGLLELPELSSPVLLASPVSRALLGKIRALAETDAGVIIEGETGTGKEIAAALIHHYSCRKGPFMPVMTSSLPETLVENELFGHRKGAYSGAVTTEKGKFEAADGGTVFLDEVADMPAAVQAKLLRVLENGEVYPVGATSPTRVNVRVIAASNVSFSELVESKRLRSDIYYRLKTFRVRIPALRERREEILPMFKFFLSRALANKQKTFMGISPKAVRLLLNYPWPGNVRELKSEATRVAALLKSGGVIHGKDLCEEIRSGDLRGQDVSGGNHGMQSRLDRLERRLIEEALTATNGNKSRTAQRLGVSRKGLAIKMKRLGIE